MGQWTKDELEAAFQNYLATVRRAIELGDWNCYADQFTEDATYLEHMYGDFCGREEIRGWITTTMGSFPGSVMTQFPPTWWLVDTERGRIVCELENHMPDPGDGSVHTGKWKATNITILTYAGDNLWSCEEDVYNPAKFAELVVGWARRCQELGTLTPEAESTCRGDARPGYSAG